MSKTFTFYLLTIVSMSMLKEFKEFAMKGNVVDLAVGVVIGTAFGKIINSLVSDIIMPIVWFLTAWVDVKDLAYKLIVPGVEQAVELKYGMFIQTTIDFMIIAFTIFVVIKVMNKAMRKKKPTEESPTPVWPTDIELLSEIRDLLKKKSA